MKKILIASALALAAVGAIVAKSNEPVVMTVAGKPVYKSEFEYLYNKNAGQQVEHQSLNDYADMFVRYKLKVADAEAAGIDTVASVRKELAQYKTELAQPYMRDTEVEKALLDEAYQHYQRQIHVSHIMLPPVRNANEETASIARLDSIRTEIEAGRLDWADAAARYSIDRGTNNRGGDMGWMVPGRLPWPFEETAYKTKVGEISYPVNSGYGFHIIRVEAEKANPGEVNARHILKLTARKSDEEAAQAKVKIDSLYTVLTAPGADFADVATRESEDPGSAKKGGDLGWFGSGMMVQPFDSIAFAMKPGEISKPFATAFGWHIIEKLGERPIKSREEMKDELIATINNSERGTLPERARMEQIREKFDAKLNQNGLDRVRDLIKANAGGYDSTMVAQLYTIDIPVASVNGKDILVSDVMKYGIAVTASHDAENARGLIASGAQRLLDDRAREAELASMMDTNPDYRNLVNEYRDGILLFEISQEKVWQRASADREGLEKFYAKNRKSYTFDEPRFKGIIVFTSSDSLEHAIREFYDTLPANMTSADVQAQLREKFGKNLRAERVIAKKGENVITDYLAFDGPRPDAKATSWTTYFALRGKIVSQPEEVDDVRGAVTTDYQNALEEEWVAGLRKKYPVKIDRKVLSTITEK